MEITTGIPRCFDFSLSVDQKRFGLHFNCDSIHVRNESRASRSMRLTLERFKKLDGDNLSFLRKDSFFFIRVNIGPFIQDTGFLPLSLNSSHKVFTSDPVTCKSVDEEDAGPNVDLTLSDLTLTVSQVLDVLANLDASKATGPV